MFKPKLKKILSFVSLSLLLVFYQNCGPSGFEASESEVPSTLTENSSENPLVPSSTPTNEIVPVTSDQNFKLLSDPKVGDIQPFSARIEWSLSEAAQGQIEFGESESLELATEGEKSFKFSTHSQMLTDLKAGTKYYYKIMSYNQEGDEVVSKVLSFKTLATRDPALETPIPTPTTPTDNTKPGQVNSDAYFVAVNGSDKNDGRSEKAALRTIQKGIEKLVPGHTLYVKAGNYGHQQIDVKKSGTKSQMITIEGYQNKPGDNPTITSFDHKSSHDSSIMPLLDSGSRKTQTMGIYVHANYIHIKNFQVTRFRHGVYASGVDGTIIENIIASKIGNPDVDYNGHGLDLVYSKNSILRNSVIVNSTAQAITLSGSNNLVENNKAYCDDNSRERFSNTGYYFILSEANDNIIRNNYIERVGNLWHGGHGFTVKHGGERNVFEGNTAVNMENGGYVVRHRGVVKNIFRNNVCENCGQGILARDGASQNRFENMTVNGGSSGISFMDSTEEGGMQGGGFNNVYSNIKIKNVDFVIRYRNYTYSNFYSNDNIFENIQADGANYLIYGEHFVKNNFFKNSKLKNIKNKFKYSNPRTASDIDIKFRNVTCEVCGF